MSAAPTFTVLFSCAARTPTSVAARKMPTTIAIPTNEARHQALFLITSNLPPRSRHATDCIARFSAALLGGGSPGPLRANHTAEPARNPSPTFWTRAVRFATTLTLRLFVGRLGRSAAAFSAAPPSLTFQPRPNG